MATHQLQVERRTGKVRRPKTDVLPLCYATNRNEFSVSGFVWFCVPGVSGSSAKIKAELDKAASERQRDEVSTGTLDVAVVEDKPVVGGRLDDQLDVGE